MRRRRAGRSVLIAIAVFALAQLAMNIAIDTIRPEWRDPEFGWRLKAIRKLNESRGSRPIVLVLGSSRTQMGFRPASLGLEDSPSSPIVYNAGQAGSGPMQMLLNLRRYLDAGIQPSAVLVEVLPTSLTQTGTAESHYQSQVVRLSGSDLTRLRPYCEKSRVLYDQWLRRRMLPWYSLRFPLLSHWQASLLPWQQRIDFQWRMMDSRGWAPFPFEEIPAEYRAQLTAETRRDYEPKLKSWTLGELADRTLRDILKLCRERGIRVALFRMPEGSMFRDWTSRHVANGIDEYLQDIQRTHHVKCLDASSWLPDDAFSDGHHLMKHGAREFSERFGREFLAEWLTHPTRPVIASSSASVLVPVPVPRPAVPTRVVPR